MNTAQKLTKNSPKEIITEMNAINPNLLLNAVATDPKHLTDLIMIYQGQLQSSNKKLVDNATKRLEDLQNILDYKVVLTKMAFGLYDESDAIQDIQTQIDFPEDNVIRNHDFVNNTKIDTIPAAKPSFYNRVVIIGTATELPKDIIKLIAKADNAGKIDEITRMMINLKRPEEALNLAIDLFDKLSLKSRDEVEKRFMFETLPVTKGVKLTNPQEKGIENMTLDKWVQYLDDAKETIKSKAILVSEAVKESKKLSTKEQPRHISFKTQLDLEKFNRIDPAIEDEIIDMIAKELKVKSEDLIWDALNNIDKKVLEERGKKNIFVTGAIEEAVIVEEVKGTPCTLAELKSNTLAKFNDTNAGDKKIKLAHQYFKANYEFVTDLEKKENEEVRNKVWDEIKNAYKDSIGNNPVVETKAPIVTPPPANANIPEKIEVKGFATSSAVEIEPVTNKEAIVEAAHEKAIELEKKESSLSTSEVKLRAEVQEIISSKYLNPLNKIRSIVKLHKGELKKNGLKVPDPVELFKELSENTTVITPPVVNTPVPTVEEKKQETSKVETLVIAPKTGIQYPSIDVEKEYPEIWKGAKLCNNLGDFVAYITMLLEDPNKHKDIKAVSGRTTTQVFVTSQLAAQYLSNFEECKTWDNHKKADWWIGLKNKYVTQKESGIKLPNVVNESSGTQKAVDSSEKKGGDLKKGEQNGKNAIPGNTTSKKENSTKSQPSTEKVVKDTTKEVQSKEQVVKQSSTTENTVISTPEKNVQNPPVTTIEAATKSASTDVKKESEVKEGGKPGEQTVVTTSTTEKKDVKDASTEAVVVKEEENKVGEGSPVVSTVPIKEVVLATESLPTTVVKEEKSVNSAKVGESTPGKQPQENPTNSNVNGDKYSSIIKEKEITIIKKTVEEILLDTTDSLTFNQKIEKLASEECLKKNRKWDKCPAYEIMNFISATIKNYKSFDENKEAKEFIAITEAKKLEIQNAKKNEKKK
jgi:hypothetical protein